MTFTLGQTALSCLMPMALALDAQGHITAVGPTLAKLLPTPAPIGQAFDTLLQVRRPAGIASIGDLLALAGERLHVAIGGANFRGLAVPLEGGGR